MMLWRALDVLNVLTVGTIAAVLPSPGRDRIARDHDIDVPLFSFAIGAIEAPLGIVAFMAGGIAHVWSGAGERSLLLVQNWWPGLSTYHFQGVGLLGWLAWFLHPLAWACALVGATGMMRLIAFTATRTAIAEPAAVAVVALSRLVRRKAFAIYREHMLGPVRPDRFVRESGSDLVLLASREKGGWNERVTLEIGGKFYRITGSSLRRDGRWHAIAYRLREDEQHGVIRRLVRHDRGGSENS
ncbi:MAG: hypothetical protein OEQ13_13500 [Acidobacteriota bacterium]|nr:hypothetical protein [Acidobacteriota bacterium]